MGSERQYLVAAAVLACVTLLLNAGALSGHWRWDDTQILLHIHEYGILSDFLRPEVWQAFSPANLTPWLIVSWQTDLMLFGLRPSLFYLHQLLALAALAWTLYLCLRLWTGRAPAWLAALLFLVGAPAMLVTEQLMTRHYVEGAVFCLLALYGCVRWLRGASWPVLALAVAAYALSVTAKEVYVPLVLLLPFLPEADWRQRLRAVIPFAGVALGYTLWRAYMLGSMSGGYTEAADYLSPAFAGTVLDSFLGFPQLLNGSLWPLALSLYLLLVGGYVWTQRSGPVLSGLVAALVLLPLVPLASSPGIDSPGRYLFLPWLVISFSCGFYADRLASRLQGSSRPLLVYGVHAMVAALVLVSLPQGWQTRRAVAAVGEEFDAQARFLWRRDGPEAFVPSDNVLSSFWFVTGLQEFKRRITGGDGAPEAIVDPIYLDAGLSSLYVYDQDCRCMRDGTASIGQRLARHRDRLRPRAPLELEYAYQDGVFSWEFGPYREGSWHAVSDVIGVIPLARQGRLRVTLEDGAPFHLRYTAPDGWVTYSEQHRIRAGAPVTQWRRP